MPDTGPSVRTEPVATSPIHPAGPSAVVAGWQVCTRRSSAALRLADWTAMSKVLVRASGTPAPAAAGVPFGRAARRADDVLVVGSGPEEWLLIGPPGTAGDLVRDATAGSADRDPQSPQGGLVSVVDVTHGRALVRITGADSPKTLAKLCPIDLRDRATPDGTAFRSTVGRLTVDVIRDDVDTVHGVRTGPLPSYLLHCERSTGQHLFDLLLDAGAEFEIDIDGFDIESAGPPSP